MRDETLVRLLSFVLLLLRSLTPTPARSITAHSGHGLHGHRMPERGQSDRDGGSLSGDAFDGNPALMFIDDLVHDAHAQTGAAGRKRTERFEHALDLFFSHADPHVTEGDFDLLRVRLAAGWRPRNRNRQLPALGHGRDGVAREVPEDLANLPGVGLDQRRLGRETGDQLMTRVVYLRTHAQ